MLHTSRDLTSYLVQARDDSCGEIKDLLFDDGTWNVRYMAIDTGNWLPGRKVIIPPHELDPAQFSRDTMHVSLTRRQIENSPPLETDKPVSRQHELKIHGHYRWQPYWTGDVPPGESPQPIEESDLPEESNVARASEDIEPEGDPHLRSINELRDYRIEGTQGRVGKVHDIIVDDGSWMVRHFVVDLDPSVDRSSADESSLRIVPVENVERVEWDQFSVFLDANAEFIRQSPEFDPTLALDQAFDRAMRAVRNRQEKDKRMVPGQDFPS